MLRTKSLRDPVDRHDGLRLLVTRYARWPAKSWNRWDRRLAPSPNLLRAFKHEGLRWRDYRFRYLAEVRHSEDAQQALQEIASLARRKNVTLLCFCRDESRCHRGILRSLLSKKVSHENRGKRWTSV